MSRSAIAQRFLNAIQVFVGILKFSGNTGICPIPLRLLNTGNTGNTGSALCWTVITNTNKSEYTPDPAEIEPISFEFSGI